MRVSVRAHPGAKVERAEQKDGAWHFWVKARATDGKANESLVDAVARAFGVSRSRVRLISGQGSRNKVFEVEV